MNNENIDVNERLLKLEEQLKKSSNIEINETLKSIENLLKKQTSQDVEIKKNASQEIEEEPKEYKYIVMKNANNILLNNEIGFFVEKGKIYCKRKDGAPFWVSEKEIIFKFLVKKFENNLNYFSDREKDEILKFVQYYKIIKSNQQNSIVKTSNDTVDKIDAFGKACGSFGWKMFKRVTFPMLVLMFLAFYFPGVLAGIALFFTSIFGGGSH